MRFIIVPGLDGSDHHHWQSAWESSWLPNAARITPASWTDPDRDDWTTAIDHAVHHPAARSSGQRRNPADDDVVLITHSLGCLAATHWLTTSPSPTVRGVFLVAPPDPLAPTFPIPLLDTFIPFEAAELHVPAVLIVSEDDPYCTVDAANRLAIGWDVPLISAGRQGHLNSDSDLGLWPAGQDLLTSFLAGLGHPRATPPRSLAADRRTR
ncbi:alpha/beta hydrolase [Kribbella sp. NPDC026596]|uniref:RBBP9/YdeN family alpha/beta hydrolase n=1 Tax=Kribbella sp. NPDC026596 TaxID=3155122 RepID=UPI00340D6572